MDYILPIALIALLAAALHDIAARTIPNRIALGIAALGLLQRILAGELGWGLVAAGAVFILGILAWRYGVMGGGDVKLLAACALLASPWLVPDMILAIALAGGVLALGYILMRRLVRAPAGPRPDGVLRRLLRAEAWRISRGGPLPYGVAIFGGVVLTLAA